MRPFGDPFIYTFCKSVRIPTARPVFLPLPLLRQSFPLPIRWSTAPIRLQTTSRSGGYVVQLGQQGVDLGRLCRQQPPPGRVICEFQGGQKIILRVDGLADERIKLSIRTKELENADNNCAQSSSHIHIDLCQKRETDGVRCRTRSRSSSVTASVKVVP